jgi:hypothetical protein
MRIMEDDEHRRALEAEGRVLLAITPDAPAAGLDGLNPRAPMSRPGSRMARPGAPCTSAGRTSHPARFST